ncbi:MAG: hypothetical protein GX444_05235 [Myxococcales bacterium]|nr:hypothetical protein [Myxococcales bacterium]
MSRKADRVPFRDNATAVTGKPRPRRGTFFFCLAAVVPLLGMTEQLASGERQILFFRDYFFGLLWMTGLMPLSMAFNDPRRLLKAGAVLLVVALVVSLWRARRFNAEWWVSGTLTGMLWLPVVLLAWLGYAFWFLFAACDPPLGAVGGLLLLAGYFLTRRRTGWWRRHVWLWPAFVGPLAFLALNLADHYRAEPVPQTRLSPTAAYEAQRRSGTDYIADAAAGKVLIGQDGDYRPVPGTSGTQTMLLSGSGDFFTNYWRQGAQTLVRLTADGTETIDLPGCEKPLGIDLDEERGYLLVACETSCTIHRLDLNSGRLGKPLPAPCYTYYLKLDHQRQRAYAAGYLIQPVVIAFDPATMTVVSEHPAGFINAGLEIDEAAGRVFVADIGAANILVFDSDLRLLGRIAAGVGPRDLAIDAKRGVLLAGNYFSGTVAVIDLQSLRVVRRLRIGRSGLFRRLRGVSVGDNGSWLIADRSGVWRVDPADRR